MPPLALRHVHRWDLSPEEAVRLQERLAALVQEAPLPRPPRTVGGIDVGVRDGISRAAVVVMTLPDLDVRFTAVHEMPTPFPYIPGLLSFREVPVILKALEAIPELPDVLLCDAQGRAHPRRLGLASHLGVLLDHPTVGCAKSRLVGRHPPVPDQRGAWVPLVDRGETVGAVVRTRPGVKPVYVSVGHRITLAEAVDLVVRTAPRYRLPEPLRLAHRLSQRPSEARREGG